MAFGADVSSGEQYPGYPNVQIGLFYGNHALPAPPERSSTFFAHTTLPVSFPTQSVPQWPPYL
ncbi:hypothetical protein OBBRIDRAFT_794047 [Obba rivulosa]|uniref:Uncharacterized protein n=1 Tax=Obba rivulosa TaxID=1052685 RepID=A0A8E2DL92_9APHY|nr:hypothetical protein OBBRIDRAFT_794047 [Obba rivulosa]